MNNAELLALRDDLLASCDGFNRKDIAAWLDPFHDDAVTFNKGFIPISTIRQVAEGFIASAKSFTVDNLDGRILDDTAILFGDYRFELVDGTVEVGAFSATLARTDGNWKTLMTHYTPQPA